MKLNLNLSYEFDNNGKFSVVQRFFLFISNTKNFISFHIKYMKKIIFRIPYTSNNPQISNPTFIIIRDPIENLLFLATFYVVRG